MVVSKKHIVGWGAAALFLVILGMALLAWPALAQDYSFTLDKNISHVYVNSDGSVDLEYYLTFTCDEGAHAIDIVDVGMPNSYYELSSVTASVDGTMITDIRPSEYVKPGVEVHLGDKTIQPGQTGTLRLRARVPRMVYYDRDDKSYTSVEFSPTWFGSQYVHGTTFLEVNFHFPPGVTGDETKYHYEKFTSWSTQDDRIVFTWRNPQASGSTQYTFGIGFPTQYVDTVYSAPAFNFLGAILDKVCGSQWLWIVLFFIGWSGITWLGGIFQKRRRMRYLPPALSVEGVGIKRGLTAVEAAILLEVPLNKVLTMILFGLLKKGMVTVQSDKPLKLKKVEPPPEGVELRGYEKRFLEAITTKRTLSERQLRKMVVKLIKDVNEKIKGFSRRDTVAYYRDIVKRAWEQVAAGETPQVKSQRIDEGLEWTMLDEDFDGKMRRTFRDEPVFLPRWWWGYQPWVASSGGGGSAARPATGRTGGGTPIELPTLPGAAFADTLVTGVEGVADRVVGSIEKFTGGVTQTTNPPSVRASSGSGGGGYGCACACACAGCACACAGGGR